MESSTTIRKMLANGQIIVPSYQRAYSWERDKQVSQFLQDLEEYRKSQSHSAYYFGHFLFENKGNDIYHIVDGQQRLTTIVIFVAALFQRLKEIHNVNGIEKLPPKLQAKYGEMIKYYE